MSSWTKQEVRTLTSMVQASDSWASIHASMPGRSQPACQAKARQLRLRDETCASNTRTYSGERGRPRSTDGRVKMSFRLDRAVRDQFVACGKVAGLKPGAFLRQSLERVGVIMPKLPHMCKRAGKVSEAGERVAVSWCVPAQVIEDAVGQTGEGPYATAEQAVIETLEEYGYRITT